MNRERFGISITKKAKQILDNHCNTEHRTRSNMLEVMIINYDTLMKTKY